MEEETVASEKKSAKKEVCVLTSVGEMFVSKLLDSLLPKWLFYVLQKKEKKNKSKEGAEE